MLDDSSLYVSRAEAPSILDSSFPLLSSSKSHTCLNFASFAWMLGSLLELETAKTKLGGVPPLKKTFHTFEQTGLEIKTGV